MDIINLYENYNSYFNDDLKAIFTKISKIASKNRFKIFLVGGLVRDLILKQESLDIDITVEGDAIEFAHLLEKENIVEIKSIHKDFGTAKIEIEGYKIDLASTRSEAYPKKGHLPKVEKIGCSIKEDVLRRDFTINSLAMSLNENNFGELIDYVDGYKDLKNKKIKILHDDSFIDDPTRIIRGLKYATRLDFELDEKTRKLQDEYLNNINYDMGYKRIKQEIKKTFDNCRQETFNTFIDQKIYKLITKNSLSKFTDNIEKSINIYHPKHPWLIYFGLIVMDDNIDNFELSKYESEVVQSAKNLINKKLKNDFEIYKTFNTKKLETLLILSILGKEKEVTKYLTDLNKIKLNITGKDLLKLGYKPSKSYSEGFDYVLKQKIKNPKIRKEKELKLIQEFLVKTK